MLKEKVEEALGQIRPVLEADGGGVELVEVAQDGTVKVRLTGGCCGCPSAQATLVGVVEKAIKSKLPQVKKVEAV